MKNKLITIILLSLTLSSCGHSKPLESVITAPKLSMALPTDTSYCVPGCAHLAALNGKDGQPGCEESRPLHMPNGSTVSCADFCLQTHAAGRDLYPSCWMKVNSCDQIEAYRAKDKPCL